MKNIPDTLGRRPRFARTPSGKKITLNERDYLLFQKLHQHGPLPSSYLIAFSRSIRKGDQATRWRLRDLYHESGHLDRPMWQANTIDPRNNDLVYELSTKGEDVLRRAGMWSEYAPKPHGANIHHLMTACITASIELSATISGNIKYIPQHQILERADTPLRFPVTFSDPITGNPVTKNLIPDALFGLDYGGSYRFYFVEADRDTEANKSLSFGRKSYLRTILQYRELIGRGLYKEPLNLTAGALVLNVTTSETHKNNLIELTGAQSPNSQNNYMLYKSIPNFAVPFKPPQLLTALFTPWDRAGTPFDISKP